MQNSDSQEVILVDGNDKQIGVEEKLAAHQSGAKLHRAISVFVFNSRGETMLQRRAMDKYHTQGKWSNTCCSHPFPGETAAEAAHRRLKEEMGIDCDLHEEYSFIYKADVGNGLTEHEYDHVFFGYYDGRPRLNKAEAMDYRWVTLEKLKQEIKQQPDSFTPWLIISLDKVASVYNKKQR